MRCIWSLSPENLMHYGGKHNGINYLNHHLKNRAVERPCYCCVTIKQRTGEVERPRGLAFSNHGRAC